MNLLCVRCGDRIPRGEFCDRCRERLKLTNATESYVDEPLVNHPKHYNSNPSGIECIQVIEHMTFNAGSAVKYLWRAGLKDSEPEIKDLKKALWYVTREIERVQAKQREAERNEPDRYQKP